MQRRKYSREFKLEAVKMIRERGVSVAQASRDLDVHQTVLRKWIADVGSDPVSAFPGHGQMKPEQILSGIGTMKQARLIFSMAYSMAEFRYVVDFLNRGHLDPRLMISSTIRLDALPAMIETLRSGGSETKVQVDPGLS
jgi:transposase